MQTVEVGLFKQVSMCRQEDQRSHRQALDLWKPLLLKPERNDEGDIGPRGRGQFVQDLVNQRKWQKGVCLEAIPFLKKGICVRCHGIGEGREIDWGSVIESGGEEIDSCWPPRYQLIYYLLSQGPFRTEDLVTMAQGVRYYILGPHNKLENQRQVLILSTGDVAPPG